MENTDLVRWICKSFGTRPLTGGAIIEGGAAGGETTAAP
jgi:hypothetical protein